MLSFLQYVWDCIVYQAKSVRAYFTGRLKPFNTAKLDYSCRELHGTIEQYCEGLKKIDDTHMKAEQKRALRSFMSDEGPDLPAFGIMSGHSCVSYALDCFEINLDKYMIESRG